MNWFDIIVLVILIGAFVRGIQKGLILQLTGLVAIILGAIFASKIAVNIIPFLLDYVDLSINIATVISYILAFIIIVFCIKFVGKIIQSLFEVLYLGFINKILGAILGVITSALVLSILINLTIIVDTDQQLITEKIKKESIFYDKIQRIVPSVVPSFKIGSWKDYLPEELLQERQRPNNFQDDEGDNTLLST